MSKLPANLQQLTDELPSRERADIEAAIASSPYLQQRMADAILAGQLEHIRLTAAGMNEGGHYDDRRNAVYVSADTFTNPELARRSDRLDVLTSTLGHETGHALNAKASEKTLYFATASITDEIRAAGPGGAVDLTNHFAMYQRSARSDEASAEIEGWNALASRLQHLNSGPVSREEMLIRAASSTNCVTFDKNGDPQLAKGIVLNPDMSMSDRRLPKAGPINLEPVAVCHFDKSEKTLGTGGAANYANYYGAYLTQQIGQDTEAWSNPPTIKLDMAKLGLDKAQLESTGLNLGGRDLHFVDISRGGYKPVVVQHSGSGVKGTPDAEPDLVQRPQAPAAPLMSEPTHPAHAMYAQVVAALRTSPNIPAGTFTQHEEGKLAVGIVAQALTQEDAFSKAQVDHAVLSRDGRMVIGVQGVLDSPANRLAGIDVQQALSMTSIEQSSDVARTAMQSIQQKQQQVQTQAETFGIDAPTSSAPIMRMGARSLLNPSTEIGDGSSGGGAGGSGGGG